MIVSGARTSTCRFSSRKYSSGLIGILTIVGWPESPRWPNSPESISAANIGIDSTGTFTVFTWLIVSRKSVRLNASRKPGITPGGAPAP